MLKIYSAENLQAAYLLQGLLDQAGIESHILNQYAQGGMGELPFMHTYPELWLENEHDVQQAWEIITQFELPPASIKTRPCPHCSEACPENFDICWSCGQALPAATNS